MMVPLCQNKCSYTQQFLEEDMWSYSQQCVEESTILTQGRIIQWAGGSLADDGSTVKTSVPILNSFWKKICGPILNNVWRKTLTFDTRQNNPVGRR